MAVKKKVAVKKKAAKKASTSMEKAFNKMEKKEMKKGKC